VKDPKIIETYEAITNHEVVELMRRNPSTFQFQANNNNNTQFQANNSNSWSNDALQHSKSVAEIFNTT
jgi:hypothetical protein